jgi:hypothetical protein
MFVDLARLFDEKESDEKESRWECERWVGKRG